MRQPRRLATFLERYGLLVLLLIVVVFFTFNPATPQFASLANVRNILANESLLAIIAIATIIPLVAGQIDLSVGPTAGLSSMVAAGLMSRSDAGLLTAVLCAVAVGLVIGLVNGALVAKAGINSIITTLGTSSIIGASVLWYSGGLSFHTNISPALIGAGSGTWLEVPKPFYYLSAVVLVVWYVLEHTPSGRNLEASGANPRAAELVGLAVVRQVFFTFVFAGLLGGFAGLLLVAVQGGGNPQLGQNFILPAVAAAFLGSTTIRPGRYNVLGTVLAVFFLAVSVNGLTLWGASAFVSPLFNGVALIVAVGISVFYGRRRVHSTPPAAGASIPAAEPLGEPSIDSPAEEGLPQT